MVSEEIPRDYELNKIVKDNSKKIARLIHNGKPGICRIEMYARYDSDGEYKFTDEEGNTKCVYALIKSVHHEAVPLTELKEGEVHFYRIAGENSYPSQSEKQYFLEGNYVENDGLDTFDNRREGPVGVNRG